MKDAFNSFRLRALLEAMKDNRSLERNDRTGELQRNSHGYKSSITIKDSVEEAMRGITIRVKFQTKLDVHLFSYEEMDEASIEEAITYIKENY